MGKYRYKLCMAMVDECNSLDDLKEMAELTLQMNMFQYIKTQVYPMLQELFADDSTITLYIYKLCNN